MQTTIRPEIQGLRAIAVASVVLFHLWPSAVPGGYVGVDVFFVISGYLITGHLVRDAERRGRISLLGFYERRVRRLIPAATLVLLAVTAAVPLLPRARWEETAIEVVASALYVENWRLAWLAVDYLGAENVPSPVQHYWSLSIEEQFYIIWPLLMMAGLVVARRGGISRRIVLLGALVIVTAASLAASILISNSDPARAYFVTQTRIWELGLGGILSFASFASLANHHREALRLFGLTAIFVACFAFSPETAFPGYAALLPTLGCAAVIAAGSAAPDRSVMPALASGPLQYIGDTSYSIYLWHWPFIVFATALAGGALTVGEGVAVVLSTLVVSDLSKRHVEDRFRRPRGSSLRAVLAGVAVIGVSSTAALALLATITISAEPAIEVADARYPGAAALIDGAAVPEVDQFIPPLSQVKRDLPIAYRNGCHLKLEPTDLNPCVFGEPDGKPRVLLAGDSHAANWIPALSEIASTEGWLIETHTKSGCPLLAATVTVRSKPYTTCRAWGENVLARIGDWKPDLVILSMSAGASLHEGGSMVDAIETTWSRIQSSGTQLVVIADTPKHILNPPECIEKDPECTSVRSEVFRDDPVLKANNDGVLVIDMSDALCTESECPIAIGNVIAWRDTHHFTATFSRMLAPLLLKRLSPVLP